MDYRPGPGAEIEDAQPTRKLSVCHLLVQRYEVRYEIAGVIHVSYKVMTFVRR